MHLRTRCAGHGLEYLILGRIVSNPTFYFEATIRAAVEKRRHRDRLYGVGGDRGSRRRPVARHSLASTGASSPDLPVVLNEISFSVFRSQLFNAVPKPRCGS
jgi:hypothetical protein